MYLFACFFQYLNFFSLPIVQANNNDDDDDDDFGQRQLLNVKILLLLFFFPNLISIYLINFKVYGY